MKKLIQKTLTLVTALVLCFSFIASLPMQAESVSAEVDVIFDSFDDYDTDYSRKGIQGGIYNQITTWGSAAGTHVAEAGDPVGTSNGKSLRLKQTSSTMYIAWGKGIKEASKIDQRGAKYVQLNIRNLSNSDRDMGILVTDILQSTIDEYATAGNLTPDEGQEHFELAWNQPCVLETKEGVKSIVKALNGPFVTIPKGFEGTISMPLDAKYITQPGWWLQEGLTFGNDVFDLDKVFMVSVQFPERSDIVFEDPSTYTVFEIDEAIFKSDNSVHEFIDANGGDLDSEIKGIVKAKENSGITVDYKELVITVPSNTTKASFISGFELEVDTKIIIKDTFGFFISNDSQILENEMVVEFSKGTSSKYTFKINVAISQDSSLIQNEPNNSSAGLIIGIIAGVIAVGVVIFLIMRKKK